MHHTVILPVLGFAPAVVAAGSFFGKAAKTLFKGKREAWDVALEGALNGRAHSIAELLVLGHTQSRDPQAARWGANRAQFVAAHPEFAELKVTPAPQSGADAAIAEAEARITQVLAGTGTAGFVAPEPSALDQALAPLRAAGTEAVQKFREGAAQTVEGIGVGGGAAAAKKIRGRSGALDVIVAAAKKPAGLVLVVVGAVVVVAVLSALLSRRRG